MIKIIVLFIGLLKVISVFGQEQNGYVTFYYPNGKISSEGYMVNNKPDKYWKTFYPTGIIKSEGKRTNFLLDSIWVFFSETGDTIEKITYLEGKKNGYYYTYSTKPEINTTVYNRIVSKELYVNDQKEGIGYYYYPNGTIKQIVTYRNNKKYGETKEFDKNGTIITIYEYFNDFLTERQPLNRIKDNAPVGVWREYYPNDKVKLERNYKDGELNGYVKEYDIDGKLLISQLYNEGKILNAAQEDTLDIEEILTYYDNKQIRTSAYYKNGIPVGIHRQYDNSGNVIKSEIYDNNGILTGTGIIKDDGNREGKFTWFYDDGNIKSEGEYVGNRQSGKWLFYFKNRQYEQIGNFNNGYFNGEWKWFYPDSTILRIENFVSGKRNGLYIEFTPVGDTLVKGYYLDDLKNGQWFYNHGDITELGSYTNDLKEGIWKSYYSNGNLYSKGNFVMGNPDGKHYFYFENSLIKEEQNYISGIKEKTWKKYNSDGTLFVSILYQNDMETRVNGIKLEILK